MNRLRVFLAIAAKPVFLLPQVAPPMGLLYLAAYLREKFDTDIRIVNQRKDNCSVEELAKHAVDFGADVVGISALTPSLLVFCPASRGTAKAQGRPRSSSRYFRMPRV